MTEPTKNVAAETDADLDQPKEEMKPVATDATTAKVDAVVFTNKVKAYDVGPSGFKTSDKEVYNTDNNASGGGSLENVSLDASRNAGSGNRASAGFNPVDKLDKIAADNYDNIACQQSAMELEGAPDDFSSDVSTNFRTNQVYNLKSVSAGKREEFGQIYRRNAVSTSVEKLIFVRGQMDGASPSLGYPTKTTVYKPEASVGSQFEDESVEIRQSNYLIRGMNFKVENGNLTDVTFNVEEIPITSDPYTLDVRVDHGKLLDNIAQNKVVEWAKVINEKGANFYSPVASGMPQPARHARLVSDIAAVDGAIVYAAVKSMCEAYAYGQLMRPKMGGSSGSIRLGAMMTRLTNEHQGWQRSETMPKWTSYARFGRDSIPKNMSVPAMLSLLQSPSSFNGYYGNLISQSAFQQVYRDALKYVDSMGWKIDKDTLSILDQTFGWFKDTEADQFTGVSRIGIVAPYNPNEYFDFVELLDGTHQLDGKCHVMNSVTVSDGTVSTIGSNLFYGMVRYFTETFLPKIKTRVGKLDITMDVPVNFDFPTDRFTFGQFFIAEAMDKISRDGGDKYINGAYRQFKDSFGIDPIEDDVTTSFGLSNILQTASFRGLGTEPVLLEATEALKLMMSDPEFAMVDAMLDTGGLLETAKGYGTIQIHPGVNLVQSDYKYEHSFLFPEVIKRGMILPGLLRQLKMGAKTYFRTRDLPIRPYPFTVGQGTGDPSEWSDAGDKARVGLLTDVTQVLDDAAPGLYESGNFIPFSVGVYGVTATYNVALTGMDIVSVPRVNGRIAPAPLNVLDVETYIESSGAIDQPAKTLKNVSAVHISGTGVTTKQMKVSVQPIETYNVVYVYDGDFSAKMYGTATYRDALSVCTGSLTNATLGTLINNEGVYIDLPAAMTVPANVLAKYTAATGGTPTAQYVPYTAAILQCVTQNYPFIEVPTAGVMYATLSNSGEEIHDDRSMLQANEAFGLKFYARTYWERYALKYQAELFDKSNDMIDNQLERMDNAFL